MAHRRTDLLDVDKIMANLTTERIGAKVLVYDSTSSTNDVAVEYAKNKQNDGLVVFAEEQTTGRGRAGNKWLSSRADSILCSIVLVENKLSTELLSLTFAVAVAEAIGKPGRSQAKIKWPNDIMLNGKKVAGILLESKSLSISKSKVENRKSKIFIVGVGINCHQKKESFTDELQQIATSIDVESHSISDRNLLAKRLLVCVGQWLKIAANNSEKVINRWRELSIQLNHRVSLIFNGSKFTGHCIGVDPEKGLILRLDTGGIRMFDAAHSTIVK
ncbi:MAG: biotin--[acetyl-CoA-carboxylase] ligase [Planctomycetota bacterium]|jgi:BirA family biotin operon repressor/biotin-[acetyl-CoA-carboxylase] ligase